MKGKTIDTAGVSASPSEDEGQGELAAEDRSLRATGAKVLRYLKTDLWRVRLPDLSPRKATFVECLRVVIVAGRGFKEDRCALTASGLTYYTLLSIVPLFAMLFGVAKGFGFHLVLQKQLLEKFSGQEVVLTKVFDFSQSFLLNTKGGLVAGIGVALLLWTVLKLLGSIEAAFNHIWRVNRGRPVVRKFSDYLSILLVCPVMLIVAGGVTIFITSQLSSLTENSAFFGLIGPVAVFFLKLLPYALVWLLFAFIYVVIPNTKVPFKAALFAAMVAGSVYQLVQWGYVEFQVGVARQNAIYGSFAALPLFLIWVQLSWLIVLLGAEISFAIQNANTYELGHDSSKLSAFDSKLVALLVTRLIVNRFVDGAKPLSAPEIAKALELSPGLVHESLRNLDTSGILRRTESRNEGELTYQPASDINAFSVGHILEALEQNGAGDLPFKRTEELEILTETLHAFRRTIASSPANKLLKDI